MRKGLLVGVGAAMALVAASATDASACSRRSAYSCNGYAPPVAYQYAPSPQAYSYYAPSAPYGYVPPAPVYNWAPPSYGSYGNGYRGWRDCDRGNGYGGNGYGGNGYGYTGYGYTGYGYAPRAYDGYRPAAAWWSFR